MNRFALCSLLALLPVFAMGQALPIKEIILPLNEDEDTVTNEFFYHPNGKLRQVIQTDPDARARSYSTMDEMGRLVQRVDSARGKLQGKRHLTWVTMDSATTIDSMSALGPAKGAIRQFGWTGVRNPPDSMRVYHDSGRVVWRMNTRKDNRGNAVETRSTVTGIPGIPPSVTYYTNTYDARGRLVRIVEIKQDSENDSSVSVLLYGDEALALSFKEKGPRRALFTKQLGRGLTLPRIDGREVRLFSFPHNPAAR